MTHLERSKFNDMVERLLKACPVKERTLLEIVGPITRTVCVGPGVRPFEEFKEEKKLCSGISS